MTAPLTKEQIEEAIAEAESFSAAEPMGYFKTLVTAARELLEMRESYSLLKDANLSALEQLAEEREKREKAEGERDEVFEKLIALYSKDEQI